MSQHTTNNLHNRLQHRLDKLYSRINYERQSRATSRSFKLEDMRELMRRLGNPHLQYPIIHVAGTKGKGSVSTLTGAILTESGKKTGVYTSPHLETIHQRMAIDGRLITDAELLETLDALEPAIKEMDADAESNDRRPLTFFEITTAAMFWFFAKQKVDIAVIEVGLGGRLDSTNVCQPDVCVITNISLDHTRQLGNTIDAIAREKAGIIKDRAPVVSGAINPDASAVIASVAGERESRLFVRDHDFRVESESGPDGRFFTMGTTDSGNYLVDELALKAPGWHQRTNAGLAVAAIKLLSENRDGFDFDIAALRRGLGQAQLVGRTEYVGSQPDVVIDMAHNVASIAALVDTVTKSPNWKTAESRRLIMATSREKDAQGMLCLLARHFDEIIFTQYQNNPRGKPPTELLEIANRLRDQMNLATELSIEPTPADAWSRIETVASRDDIICITGSAFLVAELRKLVIDSQTQ